MKRVLEAQRFLEQVLALWLFLIILTYCIIPYHTILLIGSENKEDTVKMTIPDEYDIIVCGGGSCGCVVAGR